MLIRIPGDPLRPANHLLLHLSWSLFVFLVMSMAWLYVPVANGAGPDLMAESIPYSHQEVLRLLAGKPLEMPRRRIITYTVQPGDMLTSIAAQFDLDVETLRWSNEELAHNPDRIYPGQELVILPLRGAYHHVAEGETLEGIAKSYGVPPETIISFPLNHVAPDRTLWAGQALVIPGGRRHFHLAKPSLSTGSPFAWPLVGRITQRYSAAHRAIDIAGPYGVTVYAARAGKVVHVGWAPTGYGYTVIIDHGGGLRSLYGHLKGEWVHLGDRVRRGDIIGALGSTGNSSGPHLHFEIRKGGRRVDPMPYLPAGGPL
ncbi:MAG: peptidoglycan DD-metalloendopeptidase family protein [Chloroflexi bacterium]|nr:peptidoglycan DD-metalloendopeptidase family protein [Chloroflexota bacterium]